MVTKVAAWQPRVGEAVEIIAGPLCGLCGHVVAVWGAAVDLDVGYTYHPTLRLAQVAPVTAAVVVRVDGPDRRRTR